jgi:hypothetical protein
MGYMLEIERLRDAGFQKSGYAKSKMNMSVECSGENEMNIDPRVWRKKRAETVPHTGFTMVGSMMPMEDTRTF